MMKIKWRAGVDVDGVAKTESDHFALCLSCGGWFDMRDLAQVIDHAHDAEIDIKEGVGPPPRDEPEH